ncbi:hypothetical protein Tsubulata_016381 [Turnera subulata]|uniref:Uncharacterized protein n=1 Tax=Turnera subulata TaxID=218843 RepID=A0A9Q0F1J5_9ROSI|nr:hypothetical protein Tsubulata_016381 [Turnera subulata]
MLPCDLSFSKTLKPTVAHFLIPPNPHTLIFSNPNASPRPDIRPFAGRSKKQSGGTYRTPELEGLRRQLKRESRKKSREYTDSFFYRLKNPHGPNNYAGNFTEEELNMIGLGYDRMVRFMEKDDPNLKHPHDWYKYGEYGPYSWKGVVVGEPVRGGLTDECVTLYSELKDEEESEKLEQFEMELDFGERLKQMDSGVGFRRFWVFVRHPRWRVNDPPWEQWTLVSEVVVEAGQQRLDKWSLMARLGNKSRQLVTKCAGWFRPDIIYVKRPVYQCRFEPQDDFFKGLMLYLDPETEGDFLFDLEGEAVTYYQGLCKIVKVSQKAFVDDVVNAYEKMSEEKKSKCLEFLLKNHPVQLLHPYTKEWKAKLEEMELGCDAPDEGEDEVDGKKSGYEYTEWVEDDDGGVANMEEGGDGNDDDDEKDDGLGSGRLGDDDDEEESEEYWEEKFRKALSSGEEMENFVKESIERNAKYHESFKEKLEMEEKAKSTGDGDETGMDDGDETSMDDGDEMIERNFKFYEKLEEKLKMEEKETSAGDGDKTSMDDGDETAMRGVRAKVSKEEWKIIGVGPWRKRIKKSRIPPELFLRAAVRPFTYRNLVKEIVLTRHAILDGDIRRKK